MSNVTPFRRRRAGQPDLAAARGGTLSVIAVVSAGPGAGGTMLAAHIAVQAEVTGDGPVGLLDTDPKGDLFHWWTRRSGKMDTPVSCSSGGPADIAIMLDGMAAAGARLCVIDTAAGDPDASAAVAAHADMVVIPTDADAGSAVQAAALSRLLSRDAMAAFVVNCRSHAGIEEGNALSAMSSGGGWPAGTVHHSNAFAIAMTAGRTVTESHAGTDAARDIAGLWENLRAILIAG